MSVYFFIFFPLLIGSCASAGYSTCCRGYSCQGSPPSCYCDANCHLYGDCCSDIHPSCHSQGYTAPVYLWYIIIVTFKIVLHWRKNLPVKLCYLGYSSYMVASERRYLRHFDIMTPTRSKIFLSNLNSSTAIDYHYR